jgi:hypothetical protein
MRGVNPSGVCQAPGTKTIIGFEEDIVAMFRMAVIGKEISARYCRRRDEFDEYLWKFQLQRAGKST